MIAAEDHEILPPLISFVRLLLLWPEDWEKIKEKQKLPKPKLTEEDGPAVLDVIKRGLQQRLDEFPSPIEVFTSGVRSSNARLTCLSGRLGASFKSRSSTQETNGSHCSGRGKTNTVRDIENDWPTSKARTHRVEKAEAVGCNRI